MIEQDHTTSQVLGAVIVIACLLTLLYIEAIPYLSSGTVPPSELSEAMPPAERFAYMGSLFANLPPWVKVWMHFQDVILAAALFFALWHKGARFLAASVVVNHILLIVLMPLVPVAWVSLKLAALTHFCWIPAWLYLIRLWPRLDKKTGYGTWVTVAIAQLTFSLAFDIPDGLSLLFGG